MSKIETFDLISGKDIIYDGICTLRPPTLGKIRDVGYITYSTYFNLLIVDKDTFLETSGCKDSYYAVPETMRPDLLSLLLTHKFGALFIQSLSFFICEKPEYNEQLKRIDLYDKDSNLVSYIDNSNFDNVIDGIKQINFVHAESAPKKYRNKAAQRIYEQIHGSKQGDQKGDSNMSLANIIASVSASHNSYNLLNIWDLTVYQVYDQFLRLNNKVQIDAMSLRWAAWGTEPFDFSIWYKNLDFKSKQ